MPNEGRPHLVSTKSITRGSEMLQSELERIEELFVEHGYISIAITVGDSADKIELYDGYGHSWFYEEYKKDSSVFEFLEELRDFDIWEELEVMVKSNIPGKPRIRTLVEIVEDVESSIEDTYFELRGEFGYPNIY